MSVPNNDTSSIDDHSIDETTHKNDDIATVHMPSKEDQDLTTTASQSNELQTTTDSCCLPELTSTDSSLSRESSSERLTNIPRRSRTSELQQSCEFSQQSHVPQSSSQIPSDVPTAANSRSFFLSREGQKASASSSKLESAVPGPPEPVPSTLFTSEQLSTVVRISVIEAPTAAKVDLSRLPKDSQRVIADVNSSENSIFTAIHNKLDAILKLLHSPARTDWKPSRRSIAEQHPICLLDSLVDSIGFVLLTRGIWGFDDHQHSSSLIAQIDEIAVLVSDLQRRLTFQHKARATKQQQSSTSPPESPTNQSNQFNKALLAQGFDPSNNVSQITLIESLGRLTSCLSEVLRSNIELSFRGISKSVTSDPLISVITGNSTTVKATANGSPRASGTKPTKQVPRLVNVGSSEPQQRQQQTQGAKDHIGPFIKTVQTLVGSDLCCRLFESPELRVSLNCLQGIRAGLEELARQRAFEWNSTVSQESLPHQVAEMPSDSLTPNARKSVGIRSNKKNKDNESSAIPRNKTPNHARSGCSLGCKEVQSLLGARLVELSNAFRALYRFVGSILGGVYDEPEIQCELNDASVLGSYVTMVGFLFHHDLMDLAQWMSPIMSQVRRKIKQQTAAVNAVVTSTPRGPLSGDTSSTSSSPLVQQQLPNSEQQQSASSTQPARSTHGSASQLSSLLASPQDICLTRLSESESILYFFQPHLRKTRSEGSQIGAPADRVNRVLVWLAWEGGLMNVYEMVQRQNEQTNEERKGTPMSSPQRKGKKSGVSPSTTATPSISLNVANESMEEAIVSAIVEGCRIVKEKLTNALQLFNQSSTQQQTLMTEWTGRGDDLLEFCQRVIESVSLRYLGEMDLRNTKDIHGKTIQQQAKWKSCLLLNLGRATTPSRASQVSTRVVEALPKLFGEYCHQSLFYSCPLHQDDVQSNTTTAIASSTAASARLNGVTRDLDLRITRTQHLAESAVINSHHNEQSIDDLSGQLKDLTSQFQSQSQGVVDRHSNQIRTHTNRLEEHTTDIRRIQQLITSHQNRLESHTSEIKKFSEATAELKAEASETQREIQEAAKVQAESIESRVGTILENVKVSMNEMVQTTFTPHIDSIEKLKLTATSLTESTKVRQAESEELLARVSRLNERLSEYESQLSSRVDERLEKIEIQTREQRERIEENDKATRESILALQEGVKEMMKGIIETVVSKSKGELSAYLTEHLSQCVNNHVVYHLDRALQQRQQSSSRRKLLSWASSMTTPSSKIVNQNNSVTNEETKGALLQHQVSSPSFLTSSCSMASNDLFMKASSLIQSTHRTPHRCGVFNSNDDLTSLADTSSVMEESCSIETPLANSTSWFADVQLLDLPDPRGGRRSSNISNSFVANSIDQNNKDGVSQSAASPLTSSEFTQVKTTEIPTTTASLSDTTNSTNMTSGNQDYSIDENVHYQHDLRFNNDRHDAQATPKPHHKIDN